MRNVFFALLFANLAYFVWAHWVDTPPPPPVNESIARLPRLKLASELPNAQPATATAPTAKKTALRESAACVSVGPFVSVENSTRAADVLRAKGFAPQQRAEAGVSVQEYWVYVAGMKTDADADRTLRDLQRLGFKDAEIMPAGGDPGRRVSLGLFHDRAGADQRMWAARWKGFAPEIAERKRSATLYWLEVAAASGVNAGAIGELLAAGTNTKISVQPCAAASASRVSTKQAATPVQQPATAAISTVP